MKRYSCSPFDRWEEPDGEWILFEDHEKALAEKDRQIEEIRELLGCHPAYIVDTIRDLISKTEQIPNIDLVRIAESDLREFIASPEEQP